MEKLPSNNRYIYDPLYGAIDLPDFVWDTISCSELQRLREVRLCNINSLCLTGGANINRYEHAIGTCYLAQECLSFWPLLSPISERDQKLFLLAALLHDVATAPFGHSVEYIESKEGFDHEKSFKYVVSGEREGSYLYKSATLEPIFFGMPRELTSKISEEDLGIISTIVAGKGRFGPLINSTMDLDNIDNVFRLSYHIGLVKSGEVPVKLARSLYVENGRLRARKDAVPLIEEWHGVRKRLYSLLLLNPEEFSAKCMLSEAIEIAKGSPLAFNWHDTDYRLLEKLSGVSFESSTIISRLMKGDLYGCVGIFSSTKVRKHETFTDRSARKQLENELSEVIRSKFSPRFKSAIVGLHSIIDVDKIERQVCLQDDDGEIIRIGKSSSQLLIGVLFKNASLNMYAITHVPSEIAWRMRQEIRAYLSGVLEDPDLREVELYAEVKNSE